MCARARSSPPAISPVPSTFPRGYLESRIEGFVNDRSAPVILYCASGQRSAYAARTLEQDLGYQHVRSMAGGITLWKDRGYEVVLPRALTPDQRERYSRHLLIPEIGVEGQQKLLDAKVLLLGAGGLGSPTALYLAAAGSGRSAWSTTTSSISQTSSARCSTTPTGSAAQGGLGRAERARAQPGRHGHQVPGSP